MTNQISVQPALEFIPPNFNPLVWKIVTLIAPFYMKTQTNLTEIKAENVETLVKLYDDFQSGNLRFMIAFRHPSTKDPLAMLYLLSQLMPKVAKQQKIDLKINAHSHFIYDRGIPLWAGQYVGWLFSHLGGIPIQRGKLDRLALKTVREFFLNGKLPMTAAPEGGTNGHNDIVSPLEPGIAQMGFWCQEDLIKNNRTEQVFILPIGIQYKYVDEPCKNLKKLLTDLEKDSGFKSDDSLNNSDDYTILYRRIYRLGEHLLTLMEGYYSKFYHYNLTGQITEVETTDFVDLGERSPQENQQFAERLNRLLDTALQVAEEYFKIQGKGSFIDRCRRLEQAGWDCIYREDLPNLEKLSAIEKGLADRIAEEAMLRMWHFRLVESFVAVTGKYILEKPSPERFAETILIMWDIINKLKGEKTVNRPNLGKQWAKITIGKPISVTDKWEFYQGGRKNAKQAVTDLTNELQSALEGMII
jgi:1-acyl-sn-glycerol-3-phosphate acyltransferase